MHIKFFFKRQFSHLHCILIVSFKSEVQCFCIALLIICCSFVFSYLLPLLFFSRLVLFCRLVAANSRYTKQKWISEIIKYGIAGEMLALHLKLLLTLLLGIFYGRWFQFPKILKLLYIFENKHHKHEGSDVGMLLNSKFLVFLFLNDISLLRSGQWMLCHYKNHETSSSQSILWCESCKCVHEMDQEWTWTVEHDNLSMDHNESLLGGGGGGHWRFNL